VLELGRFLVSEVLEARSTDTLARWLLHTIADRLSQIESAGSPRQRVQLQNEAADLILKLWHHRAVLADGVDPLARFSRVFKSINLLLPDANPWQVRETTPEERTAVNLYNCLSYLTTSLMLLSVAALQDRSLTKRRMLANFLPKNEAAMLRHFERVEEIISADDVRTPESESIPEPLPRAVTEQYERVVRAWVERTKENLEDVTLALDRLSEARSKKETSSPIKPATERKRKTIKKRRSKAASVDLKKKA
jgi:hypothetical protein